MCQMLLSTRAKIFKMGTVDQSPAYVHCYVLDTHIMLDPFLIPTLILVQYWRAMLSCHNGCHRMDVKGFSDWNIDIRVDTLDIILLASTARCKSSCKKELSQLKVDRDKQYLLWLIVLFVCFSHLKNPFYNVRIIDRTEQQLFSFIRKIITS